MWYRLARLLMAQTSDYTCKICGSPLEPSKYGNSYYCRRCYPNGLTISYDPDKDILKHQIREPKRETVYSGPYSGWTIETSPATTPQQKIGGEPPSCKICGLKMVPSKSKGQFYCSTCWRNGINVAWDSSTGNIRVYKNDKSLSWDRRKIYEGPYDQWQISSPTKEQPPKQVVKQKIEKQHNPKDDTSKSGDATDEIIDDVVTASGDFTNGQPQADLVQGTIRIYSEQKRAEIPVDTEEVLSGLASISSNIEPGVENYVALQDFEYLARQGDPRFNDILTSPVILDTATQNPDEFCQQVATQNPYFKFTEIGAKGFVPNISQANALHAIANTQKNLILCFPTGSGKTTCVEAQIAKALSQGQTPETAGKMAMRNPVAIYVAPARALAAQAARDFSAPDHPFARNGWKVRIERGVRAMDAPDIIGADDEDVDAGVVADTEIDELTKTENPSIIVATPERLLSCLMNPRQHPWVDQITTMSFDEGHLIGDRSRGAKFEGEQIHLYRDYYRRIRNTPAGRSASIVFLSATMNNALELSAWQGNATGDPENWAVVWGEYQPVPIETEFRTYSVAKKDEEDPFITEMLRDIISNQNYAMLANKNGTQEEVLRPTLVFFHVKKRGYAMQRIADQWFRECPTCGYIFEAAMASPGWAVPPEESSCPMCSERKGIKRWTINFHHAGVPGGQQQEFVEGFNSGKNKVLVATSTLAAGVNTGAMSVYIGGTNRGQEDIGVSDIRQMAGRAGRQSFAFKYPEQPARVVIFTEADRETHHKRRIQSGAFLESMMADPIQLVDNLLRAVKMGSISNFEGAGKYVGSSLAYFQSAVDRLHGMNIRQALKEVSSSIMPNNADRVEWINEPDPSCKHGNIEVNEEETRRSIEGTQNDISGPKVIDWHIICRDCGAEGLMEQHASIKTDIDFLNMIDSSLRDLIGAGMLVVHPDGTLKITSLGRDIVRYHMESATAVDIIHNMVGFNPNTATPMDIAISLANVRANNDEERGAYISKDQAAMCGDVLEAMGLTPESAPPAVKAIQCVFWSLQGVDAKDVPDELRSDYMSVPDSYGGPFANGFATLSQRAEWFKGSGDVLSMLMLQLRKQVSPQQTPFAAADGIASASARALQRAGFANLHDVSSSPESDPRFADYYYYYRKWDEKPNKILPSTVGGATNDWERNTFGKWAKRIKQTAKQALAGKKFKGYDSNGKPKYEVDRSYAESVSMLNSPEFLAKLGLRPRNASRGGWYRMAKDEALSLAILPYWSDIENEDVMKNFSD